MSFGIFTSRIARSGRSRIASVARLGAVGGLRDHLDVGLPLEQHAQAGAHDPVVVCDQDPHRARSVTASVAAAASTYAISAHADPGVAASSRLSARRAEPLCRCPGATRPSGRRPRAARARACPRSQAARRLLEGEAAAVVADDELDTLSPSRRSCTRTARALRVLGGVRERFLRDAVGDELHVRRQVRQLARRPRTRPRSPLRRPSSSTRPASAAFRPRSSRAVGRSWRASVSSSSIAWLASALVSASSWRELGGRLARAAPRAAAAGR